MRRTATSRQAREEIKIKMVLSTGLIAIVGLVLLLVSLNLEPGATATGVQTFASLLLVSGTVAIVYEIIVRRQILREATDLSGLSRDLDYGGVTALYQSFRELNWPELLSKTSHLDLVVGYARTWRNHNEEELRAIASQSGGRIRVVLPDPQHEATVAELARRFDDEPTAMAGKIEEAISFFEKLMDGGKASGGIWLAQFPLCHSMYRLDDQRFLALQSHHKGKAPVPAIAAIGAGYFGAFVDQEFDRIFSGDNVESINHKSWAAR